MEFMPYWKHGRSTCRNVIFKKIQQNNVIQKVGGPEKSWLELRPEGLGEPVMGKGILSRENSLCKRPWGGDELGACTQDHEQVPGFWCLASVFSSVSPKTGKKDPSPCTAQRESRSLGCLGNLLLSQ